MRQGDVTPVIRDAFPIPQLRGALALRNAEIEMLRTENERLRQALAAIREAAEMAELAP